MTWQMLLFIRLINSLQVDESIVIINIIDRHDLFAQVFFSFLVAFEIIAKN